MTDLHSVTRPPKRSESDVFSENITENARERIIPQRYAQKDENGEPTESPDEVIERVAKNVAVAEAVYTDEDVTITPAEIKPDHPRRDELIEEVFGAEPGPAPWEVDDDVPPVPITEENAKWVAYDPLMDRLWQEEWDDTHDTVGRWKTIFEEHMADLSFIPNSPTLMNAGDELQQLSACFVRSPHDDMEDILQANQDAGLVMQSGGGMGYSFSYLRPYGDRVGSTGGIASGPLTFIRIFDEMCSTIAQGGARRGAQMGVMRCTHPDLPLFIHAKNKDVSLARSLALDDPKDRENSGDFGKALEEAREVLEEYGGVPKHLRNAVEGHLDNFNISVAVTDEFMEAARNDEEFTFINPRTGEAHIATEETKQLWSWFDLGHYVEVGEPLSVNANVILDRIAEGAHENGEPGVLFIDRANEDHSFPAESTPTFDTDENPYELHATNPCGEQWLMEYEACNLGHINLSTLVDGNVPDWREFSDPNADRLGSKEETVADYLGEAIDESELERRIETGVRFLDNVVTMSAFPLDEIEKTVRENRKIGLGIMGLAQLFVQLGVEYGSEASVEMARQIMTKINQESKWVSYGLTEQRGCFENWEDSKYATPGEFPDWFERQTGGDFEKWDDGFPIRNHNTTTIAPTGTTGMVADTTGGCEPMYNVAYYKNVSPDVQGEEMLVEFDDYFLRVLRANGVNTAEAKEECERLMDDNEFDGVEDLNTVPDEIDELFVTTSDLTGEEHAAIQCALQEGVDSSISKTVNFPNHASKGDVREVIEHLYENGAKGGTLYRDGSRSKQVLTTRKDNRLEDEAEEGDEAKRDDQETVTITEERPKVLEGTTEKVPTGYGTLYVTVNTDPETDEPFEVFGTIGKSGGYTQSWTEATSRLISLALRSGIDAESVVDQLEGIRSPKPGWDQGDQIHSVPDGIATAIERQAMGGVATPEDGQEAVIDNGESPECPECGSMSLAYTEGCKKCQSCSWSECRG